jgi:NAD+ synthase
MGRMDERISQITDGLKNFFKKAGFTKAVVGLSGGVDSALTAKLAVMALGKENVTALLMPNEGTSSQHSKDDARSFAEELSIEHHLIPINAFIETYDYLPWKGSEHARMNVQARARANILYHYANTHGAVVLGTGNKTEETLGYFTKYGDGAVDVMPIASLYKTEVWEMAKALKLPKAIIEKTPSAELRAGHTDESEIGMSYAEIDANLQKFEAGGKAETPNEKKLYERIQANRHKSELPPVI